MAEIEPQSAHQQVAASLPKVLASRPQHWIASLINSFQCKSGRRRCELVRLAGRPTFHGIHGGAHTEHTVLQPSRKPTTQPGSARGPASQSAAQGSPSNTLTEQHRFKLASSMDADM